MSSHGGALSIPLSILAPPYASFERVWDPEILGRAKLKNASIFALDIASPMHVWPKLRDAVPLLRARFPHVPVILRFLDLRSPDAARLARRAGLVGVRAVIISEDPIIETLRAAMTAPVDLGVEVEEWCAIRGTPLPPNVAPVIREVFRRARGDEHVSRLLHSIGISDRSARHRLHKRRLPPPGAWWNAARALQAALALQGRRGRSLLATALELGYHDHSALSHQLLRVFGLHATDIRGTLGWEWLLHRWLTSRDIR